MQARYYDPVIGRFYSNDPKDALSFLSEGKIQGFNRYAYVFNNPYKYTDPDGKNPRIDRRIKPIAKAVAEALGGKNAAAKVEARFTLMNPRASVKEMTKALDTVRSKPTIKQQAEKLVDVNQGKHRVTLTSPSQKVEIDLKGASHGGVPTPHTKTSPRNLNSPKQPAYNTKQTDPKATTQQEVRAARKYLEKQNG
ncbi:RHS repeat-associated core domain-containing protein [Alteromonas sp. BMJM2]|uniref:RHS repeat-associated core domain-containing protein n=1 Tax=Alteromonas sp. BMJM2 TaxID=2954241 RepID=UPI0022B31E48|nr:RHS repeat-associated core domain-containing protein [Alteromonas sp. BMJM2]